MYQICLSVKTSPELKAQKRKMQQTANQWVIRYICPKCGKEFPPDQSKMRFCEKDGMRIIEVKTRKNLHC
jgi:DNA-directed RNA polymerase subunit RPC12/RpoP